MQAEAASALTGTKSQIVAALHQAASATGTDFQYLLDTATRESGLKSHAKSATSSASGLFQFVDQTWMGLIKKYGAQEGLGAYANAISQGPDGRYRADSNADRQAIIALKNDPRIAALMAGHYASDTKDVLEGSLGRDVGNGELYAAHFLGADSACRLIKLNASNPNACAANNFPQAANANRSVFYHADGTPKSVREVYAWATKQTSGGASSVPELRTTARLNLRRSIAEDDNKLPSDALPLMLLKNTGDMTTLGSFDSLPRLPLSLSSSVLDVLSSLRPEEQERDKAA
jgi:hypothetical protein